MRVEAGRLRKALAQYYAGEGACEPVRIAIPVGAYVPSFAIDHAAPERHLPAAEPSAGQPVAVPDAVSREATVREAAFHTPRIRWRPALAALAFLVLVIAAMMALTRDAGDPQRETASLAPDAVGSPAAPAPAAATPDADATAAGAWRPAQLPVLAVTSEATPGDADLADITERFARTLVDTMARFDDLITVTTPRPGSEGVDKADYVFEMSASRVALTIDGFVRLRSVRDGRIVWSSSATRTLPRGFEESELVERARQLAIRLVEPFGIIHADFRQFETSPAMRCIFQALDFRRTMREADHLAARNCLEAVLARDESFHPAWSQLALLILDEHQIGFNPQPGPPLDRALAAALTALRLAPSSARAQQVMMDVRFARGALEDALTIGRDALARNPFDPDIMADLGSRYVRLNRPAEGLPLLSRAVELSVGRPAWYDFYAFLAARMLGAEKLSESYSGAFLADDSALSLVGRALVAAGGKDEIAVADCLRRLSATAPLFAVDPRLFFTRKGFAPELIDRIVADLGPEALRAARPQ